MKKFLALFITVILICSLAACSPDTAVSADEALDIALNEVGATRENISRLERMLELDDGIPVWEIDFDYDGNEYSFDVNAENGDIVERDRDRQD